MRGRTIIIGGVLAAAVLLPEMGRAQLSPHGILSGITRPFRHALGAVGHYPRARYHRRAAARALAAEPRAAAAAREIPGIAGSRLGWVGPPAWPTAYEDMLGFTFWPNEYAPRLRGHGFDVIADTITGRFDLPRSLARTATTGSAVKDDSNNDASMGQCVDTGNTETNWPSARIEQSVQLSGTQRAALEKAQTVVAQSIKNIKADCRAPAAFPSPERLRAFVQTLWAVRDAGISLRGPLKEFSDSLTKAQMDNFVLQQPQKPPASDPKASNEAMMNRQYQACVSQNAERAERMIKEIEMRARPHKDQAASFENLHQISTNMAKMLIASCVQPIPGDPAPRLDSVNDQLAAMNYAAATVLIAFDDFYGRLRSEQKTRLDSMAR
jgi:hypothetical protein